jgi:DNA-binding transcriptional regulator YiaG
LPNVAAVLKQEISRLARREVRSLTKSLHKASAQFRRDIAALKRRSSKAEATIARLVRRGAGKAELDAEQAKAVRFTVRSVRAQRKRLGVSAAGYAKLIGVTPHTVYSWEHGSSRPRKAQLESLVALRGLGKAEARQRLERPNARGSKRRRR